LANPLKRFNLWRKSTYLSVFPIFGAGAAGDLMQMGPIAVLSSLLGKEDQKQEQENKPFQRNIDRPKCANQEYYAYQDERFDLVIYDWDCNKTNFFDEEFVSQLGHIIAGYIADPLNEKDHAWAHL
jgi:hypothetical protein